MYIYIYIYIINDNIHIILLGEPLEARSAELLQRLSEAPAAPGRMLCHAIVHCNILYNVYNNMIYYIYIYNYTYMYMYMYVYIYIYIYVYVEREREIL